MGLRRLVSLDAWKRRPVWLAAIGLAVAATVAFAVGRDDWNRTVREPTADAAYYYAYLPSLVLDRDLDLANQYRVTQNWYRLGPTPLGRAGNVFGIGPAMFALPAFVAGHGLAIVTGARRDGFSRYETTLVLWFSIAASLGAVALAARLAARRVGAASAGYLGALVAAISGPLLYYAVRQPGYAHAFAALFATLLIERWDASYDEPARPRSLRTWIVLGAAAGAAALARPQLAVWALVLPVAALDDLRHRGTVGLGRLVARWAAGAVAVALVFAPQLLAWKLLYGAWYVVPQGPGFLRWDAPAWSETVFSSRNGLLPWAPLYAPMLLGVVALARRGARLPLALLLGLFGQALVNGAVWDWWAGGSFGGRRFDSCYAVFAVGAAALIASGARIRGRARWLVNLAFAAAALIAIATLELAARTSVNSARITGGDVPADVWRTRIGGLRGRLAAWLSSASTLPIRAAFAYRHGVDLDAYDRLVGVHVLGDTFPGLNSYPDKLHDTLRAPGPLLAPRVDRLVGLNRRGSVSLRIPAIGSGRLSARWNDGPASVAEIAGRGTLDLPGLVPLRGINTLELAGPPGLIIGSIDITAAP
jgi:hypothetical protein